MANNGIADRVRAITTDVTLGSHLASLITELSLSDNDARKIFATLSDEALTREMPLLIAMNEVTKYEGFNPREIQKILLAKHEEVRIACVDNPDALEGLEADIMVNGVMQRFKFSNNQPFNTDMEFICLMFITRGSAYEKIMKKSSETMRGCMQLMRAKYNINTTRRAAGLTLDSKTITTPRIAGSFPYLTVGLFHRGFGRSIFDPNTLFPNVDFPRAILSPMISSMLPQTDDAPLFLVFCFAVKTDDILHQTEGKTSLNALYQYMMASYNSTAMNNRVKIAYCVKWNLGRLSPEGVFSYMETLLNLRAASKALVRSSRPNDQNLEMILSKM